MHHGEKSESSYVQNKFRAHRGHGTHCDRREFKSDRHDQHRPFGHRKQQHHSGHGRNFLRNLRQHLGGRPGRHKHFVQAQQHESAVQRGHLLLSRGHLQRDRAGTKRLHSAARKLHRLRSSERQQWELSQQRRNIRKRLRKLLRRFWTDLLQHHRRHQRHVWTQQPLRRYLQLHSISIRRLGDRHSSSRSLSFHYQYDADQA